MRAKIITIVSVLAVFIGLIVFIQFNASSSAPVQGATADPMRGDTSATVTIQEYADFQCPACKTLEPILKQVLQEFPGQVNLAYNDYPLRTVHPNAASAAEAGQCANSQKRFWEYHDLLYQRQTSWAIVDTTAIDETLVGYAGELGLNVDTFRSCLADDSTVASITEDEDEGTAAKINSTPTLFVGEQRLVGTSYENLRAAVAKELGQ